MSDYSLFGLYLVMAVAIVCLAIKCLSLSDERDMYKDYFELQKSNNLIQKQELELYKNKYEKDEEIIENIKNILPF